VKLIFSEKLKSNLTATLCIAFLLISIVFGSGFFIGFKSVKYKPQILKFLVSSPAYRYLILRSTASATTANHRSDLKEVACPTDHLAIASFGQSNAANRVPREGGQSLLKMEKRLCGIGRRENVTPTPNL
jgi:hypothetical protein